MWISFGRLVLDRTRDSRVTVPGGRDGDAAVKSRKRFAVHVFDDAPEPRATTSG